MVAKENKVTGMINRKEKQVKAEKIPREIRDIRK
jgi:hypothetical protein